MTARSPCSPRGAFEAVPWCSLYCSALSRIKEAPSSCRNSSSWRSSAFFAMLVLANRAIPEPAKCHLTQLIPAHPSRTPRAGHISRPCPMLPAGCDQKGAMLRTQQLTVTQSMPKASAAKQVMKTWCSPWDCREGDLADTAECGCGEVFDQAPINSLRRSTKVPLSELSRNNPFHP